MPQRSPADPQRSPEIARPIPRYNLRSPETPRGILSYPQSIVPRDRQRLAVERPLRALERRRRFPAYGVGLLWRADRPQTDTA